ncbi:hypothetical protein NA57DRAFT_40499 [Rhizodiscina lignyota]|uniref:Acyltransferase 3 domain-containing protein n=1 Tax=Rhizodiscina lignyota TaxID=1504668 RepID=A0A9P4M561_9PEZI|nr:hypothetical protein NA57DRAFT_40499 [Rhizodiscina lignyota]
MPVQPSRWSFALVRPILLNKLGGLGTRNKPLKRTAWLDGLRGFAAFLVYWHHHQLWAHYPTGETVIFENAFGYDNKYYFVALPVVRIFFSGGHYAVTVFFVISGYVLSTKPLSLIQAGELAKAGDSIGSALFRRWLRLYIPVIGTTFLYMSCWHWFGIWTAAGEMKENWWAELWSWYAEFKNYSFVFRTGDDSSFPYLYNFHVWSIPVEFKGSIIVYTALFAFSRCARNPRIWCELSLIFYFLYVADGWYGAMFMAGMLLCEIDLLAIANELPRFFSYFESFKELLFLNLFIASLYLGGVPSSDWDIQVLEKSPGWAYLSYLKPQAVFDFKWFYLFWAALFLVASVPRLPWLKHFFEGRFCQYLGRISFALYLVHGPILWVLGDRLYTATGFTRDSHKERLPKWIDAFPISKAGPLGLEPSFLVPHVILLPVTLWLAEIVTKLFDEPSVKIASWLYNKSLAPRSTPNLNP